MSDSQRLDGRAGPRLFQCVAMSARAADRFGWAELRFDEPSGWVNITGDYGNWTYRWIPRHRNESLGHFLSFVHRDYAAGKFLGGKSLVYSPRRTVKAIKRRILSERRDGRLDRGEALDEWLMLKNSNMSFEIGANDWANISGLDSPHELFEKEIDFAFQAFWKEIWAPRFRPELSKWPKDKADIPAFESNLLAKPRFV